VLTDIGNRLQAEAPQAGGDRGQQLSALADKFHSAAQTGDLASLHPPAPAEVHHSTPHYRAHQAYAQHQSHAHDQLLLDIANSILSSS
jgi:hypothetical protein